MCSVYATGRDKALTFALFPGAARKVSSNCIIPALKMTRGRWKQLASLICMMNNARTAPMGSKRTPQDLYRVALSVNLDLGANTVDVSYTDLHVSLCLLYT